MSEEKFPVAEFLQFDDRYPFDAYMFVREGLNYAVEVMQLGQSAPGKPETRQDLLLESIDDAGDDTDAEGLLDPLTLEAGGGEEAEREEGSERHLTGQQLCEALRCYAIHQYGLMAKVVLANWGIRSTGDFGEIVYNMIKVGLMKKSDKDRRHHFDNVYDFDEAFEQQFQINQPAIHWPS